MVSNGADPPTFTDVGSTEQAIFTRFSAISSFAPSAETASSIDLTWTEKSGNPTYKVKYTPEGGSLQESTTQNSPYTLSGLESNTKYTLDIVALNSEGESASTGGLNTYTLPATPTVTKGTPTETSVPFDI